MKKMVTLFVFLMAFAGFAQNITVISAEGNYQLIQLDTLYYHEFNVAQYERAKVNARSAPDRTIKSGNLTGLITSQRSFGSSVAGSFFSTPFFLYKDGTKMAPSSTIFFKPADGKDISSFSAYGAVEPHPQFKGYYYLRPVLKQAGKGIDIINLSNYLLETKQAGIAEPVYIRLLKQQNPLMPDQWYLNNTGQSGGVVGADMRVLDAWCIAGGGGMRVAVLDDGVELNHPDLAANLLPGFDAAGLGSAGGTNGINGHGTACSGIIAASDNSIGLHGIAAGAQVIPVRIGTVTGNTFNTSDNMIVASFNFAVNAGAHVISCSWGGGSSSAQINLAISNAVTNGRGGLGTVVLFAAGNDNTAVEYPASNPNVIAVGASSMCDTRKRAGNDPLGVSCDGEGTWGSNFGAGLDVIAPGVAMTTTDLQGVAGYWWDEYVPFFNGTSSACPAVAGVMALILQVNPNLTVAQARQILESTCDKVGGYNYQTNVNGQPNGTWSTDAGHGRVNAFQAVMAALNFQPSITQLANSDCETGLLSFSLGASPLVPTIVWSATNGIQVQAVPGNPLQVTVRNPAACSGGVITATASLGCIPLGQTTFNWTPCTGGGVVLNYGNWLQHNEPAKICVNDEWDVWFPQPVVNVQAYNWTVGSTLSIVSGQGTSQIRVKCLQSGAGQVTGEALTPCGNMQRESHNFSNMGLIIPNRVIDATYNCSTRIGTVTLNPNVPGAVTYQWTVSTVTPAGTVVANITSFSNTTSYQFPVKSQLSTICVQAFSSCGSTDLFCRTIDIAALCPRKAMVSSAESDVVKVTPNPVDNQAVITVPESSEAAVTVEVSNQMGMLQYRAKSRLSKGKLLLDMSGYKTGVYTVLLKTAEHTWQVKVVKL